MRSCSHLAQIRDVTPRVTGCKERIRARREHGWLHLRLRLTCGHVGCCDSSPGKRASAHHDATGHPMVRSFELGVTWRWCFDDNCLLL